MYKNSTKNLGLPQYDVQDYFQPITDLNPAFEKIDDAIGESKEFSAEFSAEMERRVSETESDIVTLTGRINALRAEHDADHAVLNGLKDWEEEAKGQLEQLRTDVDENTSSIESLTQELNDEIQRAKSAEGDLGVRISAANVAAAEAQVAAGRAEKAANDANEAAQQAKADANTASTKAEEAASSAEEAQESSSQAVEKANEVAQSVTDITANLGTIQDNLKNKPNYNGYVNPDTEGTYENPINTPLKIMSEKVVAVTDIPPGKYVYDTAYINGIETANSASIQVLTTQQTQLGVRLNNFDTELDSLGTRVGTNEDSLASHDSKIQLVESGLRTAQSQIEKLEEGTINIRNITDITELENNEIAVATIADITSGICVKSSDGNSGSVLVRETKSKGSDTDNVTVYNVQYIDSLEESIKTEITTTDEKAAAAQVQAEEAIAKNEVTSAGLTSANKSLSNIQTQVNSHTTRMDNALGNFQRLPATFPSTKNGAKLIGVVISCGSGGDSIAMNGFIPNSNGIGANFALPYFCNQNNYRIMGQVNIAVTFSSSGMQVTNGNGNDNFCATIASPPVPQNARTITPIAYGIGVYV